MAGQAHPIQRLAALGWTRLATAVGQDHELGAQALHDPEDRCFVVWMAQHDLTANTGFRERRHLVTPPNAQTPIPIR